MNEITVVVSFTNMSPQTVELGNSESPADPCHTATPGSGQTIFRNREPGPNGTVTQCCNMWVPWCWEESQFVDHHLTIRRGSEDLYYIWQANHGDGNFIRYSTTGFENPGTPIPGAAEVTGTRDCGLTIDRDFNLLLWEGDPSIQIPDFPHHLHDEHMRWHLTTHPGDEFLYFHRDFLRRFREWYDAQPFADPALIEPWRELPADFRQPGDYGANTNFDSVADFQDHPERWPDEVAFGDKLQGSLHYWLHNVPITTVYRDMLITNFATAPMTYNFYRLHGLINHWWHQWVGAEFVGLQVPEILLPSQSFKATITMRNIGAKPWTGGGATQLGSQDPRDNTTWGTRRIAPTVDIPPESSATFTLDAVAPAVAGTYDFRWQMVTEGKRWFGPQTPPRQIVVLSPTETTVPAVKGMLRGEAAAEIRGERLEPVFTGGGTTVFTQSPAAGTKVAPQTKVTCGLRGHRPDRERE